MYENIEELIMLAVRPEHLANIFTQVGVRNGEPLYKKSIEVRKTKPKADEFEALLYCTLSGSNELAKDLGKWYREKWFDKKGKVIGSFVCRKIDEYTFSNLEAEYRVNHMELDAMCLTHPDLIEYGKGSPLFGWHITELRMFDRPRELSEYTNLNGVKLTRPPQSWCRVRCA